MAQYALSNFTNAEQFSALSADHRSVSFRYEIIGVDGTSKGEFTDILPGGTVPYAYLNDIKRTCSFTIVENQSDDVSRINFFSDRMKIWVDFKFVNYAGLQVLSFPLGVFMMSSATRKSDGTKVTRDVSGFDLAQVLASDLVSVRYEANAGAVVTDLVVALLSDAGLSQNVDESTETMSVGRSWDPGTSKLTIVNDLLGLIGYGSIWFDGNGVAQGSEYQSPADRDPSITYRTDDDSVLSEDISADLDTFSVPNQWTLVISQPDKPVIKATYQNLNPNSPTSIPSVGRTIAYFSSDNEDATNETQLLAKAKRKAIEDSQVYETITFSTLLMPIHGEAEVIYLEHTDFVVGAKYSETEWSITLDSSAMMTHKVRRFVDVSADQTLEA